MIILDNFIQDQTFLTELRQEKYWQKNMPFVWFDKESLSPSPWLRLTRQIWLLAGRFHNLEGYQGYELWSQVIQERELGWHVDKDEHLWRETGKIVNPTLGSIYYVHSEPVQGGFLEMRNENGSQLIEPVPNRLVIHDPSKSHMVHKCTGGVRRSFLTNLWERKPRDENYS